MESWAGGTEYWEGEGGREGEKGDGDGEQVHMWDDDEAKGLGVLDNMGNIPPDDDGNPELQEPMDVDFDPGKER